MLNRRYAIALAFAAAVLPAASLLPSPARAEQAFQRFIPLLVDLPGWQGKKPEGMAMEMPGNSMITATRKYERGSARLNAQIITGAAAQGALAATHTGIKVETSEGHMITASVDGLPVTRTYTFKDKSGAVLVELAPAAMFSLSFNGVDEDEALKLAKAFNWKAIQAALPK
ncbi:MAG: hypothetical protein ACM3JD_10290 [Rudaea sp.]